MPLDQRKQDGYDGGVRDIPHVCKVMAMASQTPTTSGHSPDNEPSVPPAAGEEPIIVPPLIIEANKAFRGDLPELLKTHAGQWVAYHGSRRIGFDKDKDALCRRCVEQGLPEDEVVVRSVEPQADFEVISAWSQPFLY